MNSRASGTLLLAEGASGAVWYERTNRVFNIYIDGVTGVNIPAHSWTTIAGPLAPEFHSKSQYGGIIGLCSIGIEICLLKLNRSNNNIEIYSSIAHGKAYSIFGFGTWIY